MRFEKGIDLCERIWGEGVDVANIGVKGIDPLLVARIGRARQREQGLASETCLEGKDMALGKLSDEGELERIFDRRRAADGRQDISQTREFEKPAAQLGVMVSIRIRRECAFWRCAP